MGLVAEGGFLFAWREVRRELLVRLRGRSSNRDRANVGVQIMCATNEPSSSWAMNSALGLRMMNRDRATKRPAPPTKSQCRPKGVLREGMAKLSFSLIFPLRKCEQSTGMSLRARMIAPTRAQMTVSARDRWVLTAATHAKTSRPLSHHISRSTLEAIDVNIHCF